MAYLETEEMQSVIYEYQLEEITEGDDTLILTGIEAAIDEVSGYLTPNDKHHWRDGRFAYDSDAIFAATGTERNALILAITKTVAEWRILQLSNADVIYEKAKERYDRDIKILEKIKNGEMTLKSLPKLDLFSDANPDAPQFNYSSREKFKHE